MVMNDPVYVHILVVSKLFLFDRNGNVLNIYKTLECQIKYADLIMTPFSKWHYSLNHIVVVCM